MCPVSERLNAILKFIHEIINKKKSDNLVSQDVSLFFLNKELITKTPVIRINNNALVDLASFEKKGVGYINP